MNKEEQQNQIAFVSWFRTQYPHFKRLITCPSFGENIGPRRMCTLKKMGLSPGMPDIAIFVTTNSYPGLLIEMKSNKGRLTESQKSMHLELTNQGYKVLTCWSWDEARKATKKYLND